MEVTVTWWKNRYPTGPINIFWPFVLLLIVVHSSGLYSSALAQQQTGAPGQFVQAGVPTFLGVVEQESSITNKIISVDIQEKPLLEALRQVSSELDLNISYSKEVLPLDKKVSLQLTNVTANRAIYAMLEGTGLRYAISGNKQLIIFKKETPELTLSLIQADDISGTVTDASSGETLPGVNILVKGTSTGASTDAEGNFELTVESLQDTLVVSFVGYQTQEVPINGRTQIDVDLHTQAITGEEMVVVGYGTQEKKNVVSSVSSISEEELNTATTTDLSNNLTGKLPGLQVRQGSGVPGKYDNNINIRGWDDILVVVDGVPRPNFQKLDPSSIASISILKDASAAIYGVKAANGVMLIETKKGKKGEAKISINSNYGWQKLTEFPKAISSAIPNLLLKNEAALAEGNPIPFPNYQKYTGDNPDYPSTDWWAHTIKKSMPISKTDINISGGGSKVTYYITGGYLNEQGMYKSDNMSYNRYNLRSNFSAQLTDNLSINLMVGGWNDKRSKPYPRTRPYSLRQIWFSPPEEPIYANNTPPYYHNGESNRNVVAVLNSDATGYRKYYQKAFQSNFSITDNLPFISGLELKGLFSYDVTFDHNKIFRKEYNEYNYDKTKDIYKATKVQSPSNIQQYSSQNEQLLLNISLRYDSTFNEKHNVQALILGERKEYNLGTSFIAQRDVNLDILEQLNAGLTDNQQARGADLVPEKNLALVGRLNYNFDEKYIAGFNFRYDGTSLFPKGKRFGFFPSFSVGWRPSNEPFMKKNLNFVDNLKVRFSYGELGDNSDALGFQYVSGYTYPSGSYQFDSNSLTTGAITSGLPNPNITWYTAKTANLGIEATLWDDLFSFTFDLFQRKRTGLLAYRSINLPASFGATLPQQNLNSDVSKGLEISLEYSNQSKDFSYDIKANFSYARTEWLHTEASFYGNSYRKWRDATENRYKSLLWGYSVDGQFQNQKEIDMAPVQDSQGPAPLYPGDIRYQDWNGDGMISSLDEHPIGRRNDPEIYYGLNLSGAWKGISLTALFQGATNYTYYPYDSYQRGPLLFGRNSMEKFIDRWHHQDPLDFSTPWVPGKYPITRNGFGYSGNTEPTSKFWSTDAWYLRLKQIHLAYSIPSTWLRKINIQGLSIYGEATNIYTWKNTEYDPELNLEGSDRYPLTSTYNLGLEITF